MSLPKIYWLAERIYKWGKRKLIERSTPIVAILEAEPNPTEPIQIYLDSKLKQNTPIYVNGQKEVITYSGHDNLYLCASKHFEPWENIIAFPPNTNIKIIKLDQLNQPMNRTSNCANWEQLLAHLPENAKASWFFIINSRNLTPSSLFYGTYFACYDETFSSYRLNSWVWCSAIVVEAILKEAEDCKDIDTKRQCIGRAEDVGNVLLKRWKTENQQGIGGMVIRWDISYTSITGIIPWKAPNDISFIGSHCFIPLFEATGKQKYLHAALEIGRWIVNHGLLSDGRLLVGYRDDLKTWDQNWLYVDAGFTSSLFAKLFRLTKENYWKDVLILFTNWYVGAFFTSSGHFRWMWPNRFWRSSKKIFTRGQAWALDGIISAWEVTEEKKYFDVAQKCIEQLIYQQQDDGSWPYLLGIPESGADSKGIPIIAYQIIRLVQHVQNPQIISSAQKALQWCQEHQQLKMNDTKSYGGIFFHNIEGSISGQSNISTAFVYSSAYYLMAQKMKNQQ